MSKRKVSRVDNLSNKLMRNTGENAIDGFYKLTRRTYEEGMILKDFQKSRIIMILKKVRADRCEDY